MTGWIITEWKESGIYRIEDSINGKIYKYQHTAERIAYRMQIPLVVRSV